MSRELVKNQIQRFLSTDTPEVLAIKGDWGVGKTYSWNKYIKEFKDQCALESYSYVSLFGINSVDELKRTTFLNAVDITKIEESHNIKSILKNITEKGKNTKLPLFGDIGHIYDSVCQLSMSETIICFDDLERHSKGITIKDFMGLVSFFKEQRKCKVVLLLNEDVSNDDDTFKDYRKYKEKVVDKQLHFEPTAEHCFDIMYQKDFDFRSYIRDCCVGLKIKNKRVIRKIVEQVREFLEFVDIDNERIKKQVIHSTIVLSWCYYCHEADKNNIPNFAFAIQTGLRKENEELGWDKEKTERWNRTLNNYGYKMTDEMDLSVACGIEQGFLDTEKLSALCKIKQKEIEIEDASVKWHKAWELFHGSFENNSEDIAQALEEGVIPPFLMEFKSRCFSLC